MSNPQKLVFLSVILLALTSCMSKKKFTKEMDAADKSRKAMQRQYTDCMSQKDTLAMSLSEQKHETEKLGLELNSEIVKNQHLNDQIVFLQEQNKKLMDGLNTASDANRTNAQSLQQSVAALQEQSRYIQGLTTNMQKKDSISLALMSKLKRSLSDESDEDVTIAVQKGVIFISLSDKMLFRSGSAEIGPRADIVLEKIAKILADYKDFEMLIVGHTDNVPFANGNLKDNWDLSAIRATSVARALQTRFNIAPERITAGGRGEYLPKADNTTPDGRKINRRTEIIIMPELDQFVKLLNDK